MSLEFLLDLNVPREIAGFLRRKRPGWRIQHVNDIGLKGAPDEDVFRWAQSHGAIVVTFDEDSADTRMYPIGTHAGVIRLKVWPTTIEQTEKALERLLGTVEEGDLAGSLVIIDDERIRVRRSARHG